MSDDRKYIDENGNDLRYGHYFHGNWIADPKPIVALKKSGEWARFSNMQRTWAYQDTYEFDPVLAKELDDQQRELAIFFNERRKRREREKRRGKT